jgi:hypothetical protein
MGIPLSPTSNRMPSGSPLRRALSAFVPLALVALLTGCASTIGDNLPNATGGLPSNAPARSVEPAVYPAVHDMPPPRTDTMLSEDEVKKAEDELLAARNRQERQTAQTPEKKKPR